MDARLNKLHLDNECSSLSCSQLQKGQQSCSGITFGVREGRKKREVVSILYLSYRYSGCCSMKLSEANIFHASS